MLGAAIRNCKEIRGVRLLGSSEESKIGQYADDRDLNLVDDFPSLRHLKSSVYVRGVWGPGWTWAKLKACRSALWLARGTAQ